MRLFIVTSLAASLFLCGVIAGLAAPTRVRAHRARMLGITATEPCRWGSEQEAWSAAARRQLTASVEADELARYGRERESVDQVLRIDPHPRLPAGGVLIDGHFDHDCVCEAQRIDVRVLVLCSGPELANACALDLPANSFAGDVDVLVDDEDGGETLGVVARGGIWRSTPYVVLATWNPREGTIRTLADVGGEEEVPETLTRSFECRGIPTIVFAGVKPSLARSLTLAGWRVVFTSRGSCSRRG